MDPNTVCHMTAQGWTVLYGSEFNSFYCFPRLIRIYDQGQVELADVRDASRAPSIQDPVWAQAIARLGIDLERLEFNPFLSRWTYRLGTGTFTPPRAEEAGG